MCPERERRGLGVVLPRGSEAAIGEHAQDREVEIEIGGSGGLDGLLASRALEGGEDERDEEQSRERNRAGGTQA